MSVKLTISIPDVSDQVANGFDFIRVFRSTAGSSGPFIEITAENPAPASLTGSQVGPFSNSGLTLLLRVNRGPTQSVTLSGTPLSASQVAAQLIANVSGITAEDDGTGRLKISTTGSGTDEILEVLGESDALSVLGFSAGQFDIGEAARVPLVDGVTEYLFEDVAGSDSDYYEIDFINSSTSDTSAKSDPVQGATAETVAKQQADTRAPRGLTLLRGTTHVFREGFFKDPDCLIPMLPLDASKYPSFQIIDINGQIVGAGLATQDGDPGNYRVEFFVPKDALISNDDRRWRIEWLFIDEDQRQIEKVTEFDIRDVDVTQSEIRDQKLMAMCGKPFRAYIRLLKRPWALSLDVAEASNDSIKVVTGAVLPTTGTPSPETPIIQESSDGETFVYHYTIPEGVLGVKTYRATWTIEPSVASSPEYAFQIIEVPNPVVLQYFPSLRMVIDKYQKKRQIIQAYQDSDIHEYLVQGLNFLNGWHPYTQFSFTTIPPPLVPYWLLAAQVWGLNAQFLLETDLQFNFSGQTVTLDYDHTGNLDTAIQRALEMLEKQLTAAKTAVYRRTNSVGVMAGKPYRTTGLHNYTFKIASFGSQDFVTLLSNIGLL